MLSCPPRRTPFSPDDAIIFTLFSLIRHAAITLIRHFHYAITARFHY
jgi:hypothetical protein